MLFARSFLFGKDAIHMREKKNLDVRRITVTAMLAALAYGCVAVSNLMIPIKIEGILSLEFKDTILMIGAFLFGPVTGLLMTLVVALLEFFTISTTGWIGLIMNILSSALFVCTAAAIYKRRRTLGGAVLGLVIGALLMTLGMILWNYIITPLYMQVERAMVAQMLIPVFLPFNLLKAALNGALSMMLYKSVVTVLRKAGLLAPAAQERPDQKKKSIAVAAISLVCAVTLLLAALAWSGIL